MTEMRDIQLGHRVRGLNADISAHGHNFQHFSQAQYGNRTFMPCDIQMVNLCVADRHLVSFTRPFSDGILAASNNAGLLTTN